MILPTQNPSKTQGVLLVFEVTTICTHAKMAVIHPSAIPELFYEQVPASWVFLSQILLSNIKLFLEPSQSCNYNPDKEKVYVEVWLCRHCTHENDLFWII